MITVFSCSDDELAGPSENAIIWNGPTLTFVKDNGADPTLEENQDRITSNVWITRDNDGGQIYNIASEDGANKDSSPAGTRWAVGTLDQLDNLNFTSFRNAVDKPKNAIGENLVMHLVEDDIYLSVTITEWGGNQAGGFAYERSTSN